MKRLKNLPALLLAASLAWMTLGSTTLHAQADAPPPAPAPAVLEAAPPDATVEQRVADLEQYFQNLGVGASGDVKWKSKISDVPGPGHNGWMMTCAALVLFMTLPGLALFYGGLVRKKNVLSVLAQCLGCAGMVTILWWAFGYSLVFGKSFSERLGRHQERRLDLSAARI